MTKERRHEDEDMEGSVTSPAIDRCVLQIAPQDNVGVAKGTLDAGQSVMISGSAVVMEHRIPVGHKLALAPIAAGEKVVKYGLPIGSATADIRPGQYVHTHNLKSDYLPTYERGDQV